MELDGQKSSSFGWNLYWLWSSILHWRGSSRSVFSILSKIYQTTLKLRLEHSGARLIAHKTEWIETPKEEKGNLPPNGFCGISTRHGRKPILAAVNGLAVGGGVEVLINCDMVMCSPSAILSLSDVKVGLSLLGGTLPLLVRKTGRGGGNRYGLDRPECWC